MPYILYLALTLTLILTQTQNLTQTLMIILKMTTVNEQMRAHSSLYCSLNGRHVT